jgi:sialate O-acetylesterase
MNARGGWTIVLGMLLGLGPWVAPSQSRADIELPNIFSSGMVLQRDQDNRVWGRAAAGESIEVTLRMGPAQSPGSETAELVQQRSTRAGTDGRWEVRLAPLPAGGPYTLEVQGANRLVIDDVLVGEVWICSGQSNMQWSVDRSADPDLEKLAANYPQLRMINFPQVGSQETIWSHPVSWKQAAPENVGAFSAVGYFFGRQLHLTLDVPIGLINNAWGGSACEAWIERSRLEGIPIYQGLMQRWQEAEAQWETLSSLESRSADQQRTFEQLSRQMVGQHRPANIYHGVLESHLGYGIRGVIWYQGETNASRAYQYREMFPLMIESWREAWGQGEFPFYWVQLADFMAEVDQPADSAWAELREAQTLTLDRIANGGQAVIIDLGEANDIHPRNKADVGRRLARLALANEYQREIAHQSPRMTSHRIEDDRIIVTFDPVDGGWWIKDYTDIRGFAIAGEDRRFVWAGAEILADGTIAVRSADVPQPVAVRYGWADNPVCNLFSKAGLPLTPFRTDDWPGLTVDAQ